MNEFREWLSDNLRYFMLGFAIIAILVLLFLGFHLLTSIIDGTQDSQQGVMNEQEDDQTSQNTEDENLDAAGDSDEDKNSEEGNNTENNAGDDSEDTNAEDNVLVKNQYEQVNTLMQNYYDALSRRDVDTLRAMLDTLSSEDENAIKNSDYIESYSNVEVYTKPGVSEGSYVVFVCYGHKYKGYETVLPGMGYLYVETADDGSVYVVSQPTEEQINRITEALSDSDTQALVEDTQNAYDETLNGDAALRAYLSELGVV